MIVPRGCQHCCCTVTSDYFRCWWDFLLPQAAERWDSTLRECKETWKELHGVPLLPLASGAAGTFGTSRAVGGGKGYMLATRRQQGLIPQLKGTFVHLKAIRRLKQFFECDAFLQVRPWCTCWRHACGAGFGYQCKIWESSKKYWVLETWECCCTMPYGSSKGKRLRNYLRPHDGMLPAVRRFSVRRRRRYFCVVNAIVL